VSVGGSLLLPTSRTPVSAGETVLSEHVEAVVDQIIHKHGLPAGTEHTITDCGELEADLARTRERGYGTSKRILPEFAPSVILCWTIAVQYSVH
jgi:DNA-binding IclR family transcriptional regulator